MLALSTRKKTDGGPLRLLVPLIAVLVAVTGCAHKTTKPQPRVSLTLTTKGPFPAVSGGFGDRPTIIYRDGVQPSPRLQRNILRVGTGPKLVGGDLIVADYLGQIWNGQVFDNTYDRGEAVTLQVGLGKLIPGWDAGLVGVRVGSRVELTVPPRDGYGSAGNKEAGTSGTDTLVFVIDVARRYDNHSSADRLATPQAMPPNLPTIGGALTAAPSIAIARGLPLPTSLQTYIVARGHGSVLRVGTAAVRYSSVNWDGKTIGSSWDVGTATAVQIGNAADASGALFDGLVGVPVGSRVLIVLPAAAGKDQRVNTAAVVVDVLDQVTTAKQMAGGS
jgi:peptidylprolyl isomerase